MSPSKRRVYHFGKRPRGYANGLVRKGERGTRNVDGDRRPRRLHRRAGKAIDSSADSAIFCSETETSQPQWTGRFRPRTNAMKRRQTLRVKGKGERKSSSQAAGNTFSFVGPLAHRCRLAARN